MKRLMVWLVSAAVFTGSAGLAQAQIGHDIKEGAKSVGSATAKAAKKTGKAVKKGTKKVVHKGAKETRKGAGKVEDKTDNR
jgi:hypothetical protein